MMKKFKQQKGFTLIEMMISMSIFVIFVGVLINSYSSIVRAQRDVNNYRLMYSESRRVFDTVVQKLRDGVVDYSALENTNVTAFGMHKVNVISKDGLEQFTIEFVKASDLDEDLYGFVRIVNQDGEEVRLNSSDISVIEFNFEPYPYFDPYNIENVSVDGLQFQPMITISGKFQRAKEVGDPYEVEFRTTISSRVYNQVIAQP